MLCTLPIAAREPGPGNDRTPSMLGGVVVTWRYPVLRAVTAATSFAMLGDGALPLVAALLAVRYHAGYAAGAVLSAVAAGALVGALVYARRRSVSIGRRGSSCSGWWPAACRCCSYR